MNFVKVVGAIMDPTKHNLRRATLRISPTTLRIKRNNMFGGANISNLTNRH